MKKILLALGIILWLSACSHKSTSRFRNDFTPHEKEWLKRSRQIIKRAYFATFITHGKNGELHPRIMEPFPPDSTFVVWLGTNRLSRKVKEIRQNPQATLFYFDSQSPGYVALYGFAEIVENGPAYEKYWRKAWEAFYPAKKNYLLIRFTPYRLEMINPGQNLPGDSITWKPYEVILRK